MLAQTIVCPSCRAELKLKATLPAGMTSAKCPHCGGPVPLPATRPPNDTNPSGADHTQPAPQAPPTPDSFPFLAPPQKPDEIGRLGPYRVLAELGRGGMGVVFRAEDPLLKRALALKVMLPQYSANPADKARFLREARAQAQVQHDHVAAIYQVGEDRGVAYLAMPLLKGQSLADALRANPKVPLAEAVRIAREVAEGLAGAHEQGLVHRDIKPGNVWLEGNRRRVKILDFGLARVAGVDPNDSENVTQRGAIIGTPTYMSPEQARGEALDARSDLFSLGIVLYQMLTGRQPFRAPTSTGVLIAVATEHPPSPVALNPEVPHALDAVTMALLAKDPGARPASAEDAAALLRAIEAGPGTGAPSGSAFVVIPVNLPAPDAPPDPWAAIDATETESAERNPVVSPKTMRHAAHRGGESESTGRRKLFLTAGFFALVLAGVLTAAVIYIQTAVGTLVVEINDAEVEARFRNGKLVLLGPDGRERYTLDPTERNKRIATGTYTVRAEGTDGLTLDTREFTLKRGEKITVRVTLIPKPVPKQVPPPVAPPTNYDPDRTAADFVVSLGGVVRINGEARNIKAPADLPREPFRLTYADLSETKASDTGVAAFRGCKNLTSLYLSGTSVSDAGLAHFRDCTDLTSLGLMNTSIGDAGLVHFKNCKRLTHLNLYQTNAGDEGVALFKDCRDELTFFNVQGTKVTDAGLARFKGCQGLTFLNLSLTAATNEGLANFSGCKNLTFLWLNKLPVTDDALAPFGECKGMLNLSLGQTKVTDAGLAHFKDCPDLHELHVWSTTVTDAGLAHFRDCKKLRSLSINETKVGDAGIEHFKDCKNLTYAFLWSSQITDAGVAHLAECRNLATLDLSNTPVTDRCVDVVCRFDALTLLDIRKTKISAVGGAKLKFALPKCKIEWDGAPRPKLP